MPVGPNGAPQEGKNINISVILPLLPPLQKRVLKGFVDPIHWSLISSMSALHRACHNFFSREEKMYRSEVHWAMGHSTPQQSKCTTVEHCNNHQHGNDLDDLTSICFA